MIKSIHFNNNSSADDTVGELIFEYEEDNKKVPDIVFYCADIEGYTTLQACEKLCNKHYSCYTACVANDDIVNTLGE